MAAGLLIGPQNAPQGRRVLGAALSGAFVILALVNFWWLYPVISAEIIPYDDWHRRMMFDRWI
ncbi:hypothetical protein Sru01_68480 [Sphaerisporangium rufum]|uniref:Dolichyl-phosphate-mannose--protein mannosyltransferase n=1 Tax=Sphaerisporangium rufum TaxID=1381558 RepID=A0A919V280_9ACTN|nr:hypothetical protein Sru01_68480 [Sphaerisporangium rufum]